MQVLIVYESVFGNRPMRAGEVDRAHGWGGALAALAGTGVPAR